VDEEIVASAILFNGIAYEGHGHQHIRIRIWNELKLNRFPTDGEEGFVTNTRRFVSRQEAADIAWKAGQLLSKVDLLYSEDFRLPAGILPRRE
jgi:hypothetical protein